MYYKKILVLLLLFLYIPCLVYGNIINAPPYDKVYGDTITLEPPNLIELDQIDKYYKALGNWNSIFKMKLDSIRISASSPFWLKPYSPNNIIDKKIDTTWAFRSGLEKDRWILIDINAELDSETTTPFTIQSVGIIPGYSKNSKTWIENNRIHKARLIIYSPLIEPDGWSEMEYIMFDLEFSDKMALHVFHIPSDFRVSNEPMRKKVWLIIDDVYQGSKYNDTCVSEIYFTGNCTN